MLFEQRNERDLHSNNIINLEEKYLLSILVDNGKNICYNHRVRKNLERVVEMKETQIKLSNVQDIREFVNIVILADYEVDLIQGRYVIDAKSIMGIFSLDLLSPITLVAHTENSDALFEKIKKFVV